MFGHKVVPEAARETVPDQHLVQIALQVLTLVTIQELLQVAHQAPLGVTRAERAVEQQRLLAAHRATEPEASKT